jgi:hypothetical protein
MWDVIEHDGPHGVSSLNSLLIRFCRMFASTLAEAEDFICIGLVPNGFVLGVPLELAVFKCLSSFVIKDWACNIYGWELMNCACNGVGRERIIVKGICK